MYFSLFFLASESTNSLFGFALELLKLFSVFFYLWEDEFVVNRCGSEGLWVEKVDQEAQFQEVVEWNKSKDDSSELIYDVKCSEAYPVSEPLLIVIKSISLKGQETHECWVSNTQ